MAQIDQHVVASISPDVLIHTIITILLSVGSICLGVLSYFAKHMYNRFENMEKTQHHFGKCIARFDAHMHLEALPFDPYA